jgi:hypothetical protein
MGLIFLWGPFRGPVAGQIWCLSDGPYDSLHNFVFLPLCESALPKGYHLDVVGGPSTPPDPESDAGGSLSSWQGHPSR